MYITREKAVEILYNVSNVWCLDETVSEMLIDIANCIEHENNNLFLWGADDDASVLFEARREDLITPEWTAYQNHIYEKYKIKETLSKRSVAPEEQAEIAENLFEEE